VAVKIREKLLKTGERSLYLDIYSNGRRSYEFLDLRLNGDRDLDKERLRLAEVVRAQRELEVFAGKHGLVPDHRGRVLLLDYGREIAHGKHPKVQMIKSLVYLEQFDKTIQLRAVDDRFLARYQDYLADSGLSPTTASLYFSALISLLNQAVVDKLIPQNPAKFVKRLKVQENIREYLSIEDVQALAQTPISGKHGPEVKRGFLFACYCGLRWSDVRNLTWGMVANNRITKRQQKTGGVVYIPLHESALALIQPDGPEAHRSDELVFDLTGLNNPSRYLQPWARNAGLQKKVTFHLARHTAATLLLEHGADIATVQRILGHSKIDMSLHYAKSTDPLKKKAVDAIPKLRLGPNEQ
jgi:integrase